MFEQEIKDLIKISHYLGSDPELTQAGGGNTSVKTADNQTMLIKASGSSMVDMTEQNGWVGVGREDLEKLFSDSSIRSAPAAEREKKVLEVLYASVTANPGSRPSVETPLHILLDKVVMHSHPVVGNALACRLDGEEILKQLAGKDCRMQPLWVPYCDPGSSLAFCLYDTIMDYRAKFGHSPETIFLQNHGLFCAAASAQECITLHEYWIKTVQDYLGQPRQIEAKKVSLEDEGEKLNLAFAEACRALGKETYLARFCDSELCAAVTDPFIADIFEKALTPDHVVYIGPQALVVTPRSSPKFLSAGIQGFYRHFGILPKLVLVKDRGIAVAGSLPAALSAAEALVRSAIGIALQANGTLRFMDERSVDFIVHWEAEHYRARQVGK
jgi:rhamnulokinase